MRVTSIFAAALTTLAGFACAAPLPALSERSINLVQRDGNSLGAAEDLMDEIGADIYKLQGYQSDIVSGVSELSIKFQLALQIQRDRLSAAVEQLIGPDGEFRDELVDQVRAQLITPLQGADPELASAFKSLVKDGFIKFDEIPRTDMEVAYAPGAVDAQIAEDVDKEVAELVADADKEVADIGEVVLEDLEKLVI